MCSLYTGELEKVAKLFKLCKVQVASTSALSDNANLDCLTKSPRLNSTQWLEYDTPSTLIKIINLPGCIPCFLRLESPNLRKIIC